MRNPVVNAFAGLRARFDTNTIAVRRKNELLSGPLLIRVWKVRKTFGPALAGGAAFFRRGRSGTHTLASFLRGRILGLTVFGPGSLR
jgi:hypothetical protein